MHSVVFGLVDFLSVFTNEMRRNKFQQLDLCRAQWVPGFREAMRLGWNSLERRSSHGLPGGQGAPDL
jgi:hypothetical protein